MFLKNNLTFFHGKLEMAVLSWLRFAPYYHILFHLVEILCNLVVVFNPFIDFANVNHAKQ